MIKTERYSLIGATVIEEVGRGYSYELQAWDYSAPDAWIVFRGKEEKCPRSWLVI